MPSPPVISPARFEEGGYRQVLAVSVPLVLSMGVWSVQHFVDRMYLTWYSAEAAAASMPGGVLSFTLMCTFFGTASYVSAFVAQYVGAGREERVGPALWQGVYVSAIGGVIMLMFAPLAEPIFRAIGHGDDVMREEATYFRVLCVGGFPSIASSALAGYFSGRGRTWPVMWVNLLAVASNIVLDYLMIFGGLGIPRMGIRGAAWATVIAGVVQLVVYAFLVGLGGEARYRTRSGWRFDAPLFGRLIRFGLPSGVHIFLDVAGFMVFVMFVGALGKEALAATNVAININSLVFMPIIGLGTGVSVLVGQQLGRNRPDLAQRTTFTGLKAALIFTAALGAAYLLLPGLFIWPYRVGADAAAFQPIGEMTEALLRFVACYCLFDAVNLVFGSALKGAGDTRFVMATIVVLSLGVLVVPTAVVVRWLNGGVYGAWTVLTAYTVVLGVAFLLRFLGGKWKTMKVIEEPKVP